MLVGYIYIGCYCLLWKPSLPLIIVCTSLLTYNFCSWNSAVKYIFNLWTSFSSNKDLNIWKVFIFPTTVLRFPSGAGFFSLRHRFQTGFGAHPTISQMGITFFRWASNTFLAKAVTSPFSHRAEWHADMGFFKGLCFFSGHASQWRHTASLLRGVPDLTNPLTLLTNYMIQAIPWTFDCQHFHEFVCRCGTTY
jgi:hypothetical protein